MPGRSTVQDVHCTSWAVIGSILNLLSAQYTIYLYQLAAQLRANTLALRNDANHPSLSPGPIARLRRRPLRACSPLAATAMRFHKGATLGNRSLPALRKFPFILKYGRRYGVLCICPRPSQTYPQNLFRSTIRFFDQSDQKRP
jgi:hypothetical protein